MMKMTSSPSLIAPLMQHLSRIRAWIVHPQVTYGHADPACAVTSLRANALGCLVLAGVLVCAAAVLPGGWWHLVSAQETVLAMIADYGVGEPSEADVASLVASWNPDAVVTAGDNCYAPGDHLSNVDPYYGEFVDAGQFFPAIGNHDQTDCGGLAAYAAYFNVPRYYEVVVGPVHVFVLNSQPDEPDGVTSDSRQAEWLREGLQQSEAPWKLVILHSPPYSSGVEHGSRSHLQWPFADWGASAVLAGDDHLFEALEVDGLPYFVNGLGGAIIHDFGPPIAGSLFRYNADHGAMLINADASSIMFTFYSVSEGPLYSVTFTSGDEEVTLTVSPTTVAAGGTVTATWSGIAAPTSTDWLGLYTPGASNTAYLAWRYTTGAANGTVPFSIPGTLAPGTYELRLLANNGFTALATSSAFTVTSGDEEVTLTVSPTTVAAGGTVTATWSGIAAPTSTDWLGLYTLSAPNTAYLDWIYVSCTQSPGNARAAGSCVFPILATLAPGTYHLRLLANNGFTALATSSAFTVTAPVGAAVSGPMVTTAP